MLEVDNVSAAFGGVQAVDRCSFDVAPRSITGLIGPNGAGKTTLFNLISGFTRPAGGAIRFEGERLDGLPAHKIAHRGVVRTFQLAKAAPNMSVLESMMLPGRQQLGERLLNVWLRPGAVAAQEVALARRAHAVLEFLSLDPLAQAFAGTLSVGQQKLLEIGRALMAQPRLLLLDEPGAGVNPTLVQKIAGYIERLREQGMSILLIEHNMDLITRLCDTVIVMSEGRLLMQGTPEHVLADARVIDAYLGGGVA